MLRRITRWPSITTGKAIATAPQRNASSITVEHGFFGLQGLHRYRALADAVPDGSVQSPESRQFRAGQRHRKYTEYEFSHIRADQQHVAKCGAAPNTDHRVSTSTSRAPVE